MPRSVYVLGAGFSHNFNRETYPLLREFLCAAKDGFIYQPENKHGELAYTISKHFHDPLYRDLEKVLSFLSASPLYDRSLTPEHRSLLYDELVEIIVRLLSEASRSSSESDQIAATYRQFTARLASTEATIITFNYDLLIERLLEKTSNWQRYYGYGAHIPNAYAAMPTSPHTFESQRWKAEPDVNQSLVTVLKLHGSINWGTPIIAESQSSAIYQLPTSEGVSIADVAVRTELGSPFTQYFKPVIVPPVLDKSMWLRHPTFRVLWNMAMEAIEAAETIIFIGYSLPVTDYMAEFMFRQGINLHSTETKIVVVDPNASELQERYLDVFGSAPILDISFRDCDFVSYADEMLASIESRKADVSIS